MLSEAEVIRVMRRHIEGQFPKTCSTCRRVFITLADYLHVVEHIGKPLSYDVALGNWEPEEPIGVASMANCSCGTTLSISSVGMPLWDLLRLMRWARVETSRRGIGMPELLGILRAKIDAQVLAEQDTHAHAAPLL